MINSWASSIHAEYPFALEVIMIGDQLIYFEAPFYNSNCSIPNGSASSFREAQLEQYRISQQWYQALAFAETPRHALV